MSNYLLFSFADFIFTLNSIVAQISMFKLNFNNRLTKFFDMSPELSEHPMCSTEYWIALLVCYYDVQFFSGETQCFSGGLVMLNTITYAVSYLLDGKLYIYMFVWEGQE